MERREVDVLQLNKAPLDAVSLTYAREIFEHEGVKSVKLLPESFTKDKYIHEKYKVTIPSSCRITTDINYLYPQFRSRGIHCGMIAVALPISENELSEKFFKKIQDTLLDNLFYYTMYRLRMPIFSQAYDLSHTEFINVIQYGPNAVNRKYNFREGDLNVLEYAPFNEVDLASKKYLLNDKWLTRRTVRMRHSFGKYFGGNHFFELQVVSGGDAETFGLRKKQVVAMFHSGCQSLEDVVRVDLRDKFIRSNIYQCVSRGSDMYEAFFTAQQLLINLISTYRMVSFVRIRDIVEEVYKTGDSRIVVEKGHNSIQEEIVGGESTLVYRHNAEQLSSNNIAIVSGDKQHRSYLVRGGSNISDFGDTIDHGIGGLLRNKKRDDIATGDHVTTVKSRRGIRGSFFVETNNLPIFTNPIEEEYLAYMRQLDLINSYVSLRPIFNIKYV